MFCSDRYSNTGCRRPLSGSTSCTALHLETDLNTTLQLRPDSDFKSRVTYSARLDALAPDTLTTMSQ